MSQVYPGLQRIIDVLKQIDNSPTSSCGFDMVNVYDSRKLSDHPCGTACCIGGWAELKLREERNSSEEDFYGMAFMSLMDYCSVPEEIADAICYPDLKLTGITLEQAIKCLEHCRDTGEVDWQRAMESDVSLN